MIYAEPGANFTTITNENFLTGLVGTIGVRIENPDGTTFTARTTIGVTELEPGSGVYSKTNLVAPTVAGTYIVLWDSGGVTPQFDSEELRVTYTLVDPELPAAEVAAVYATSQDLITWLSNNGIVWDKTASEANRMLKLAERDVDSALGFYSTYENGRKMGTPNDDNERGLSVGEREHLRDATCAQAHYRLQLGPDFFIEHQRQSSSGPDISEIGKVSKIGPQTQRELINSGLLRLTGRMR